MVDARWVVGVCLVLLSAYGMPLKRFVGKVVARCSGVSRFKPDAPKPTSNEKPKPNSNEKFVISAASIVGLDLILLAGMEWNAFVTVGCCGGFLCVGGMCIFLETIGCLRWLASFKKGDSCKDVEKKDDDKIEATNEYQPLEAKNLYQLLTGAFLRCVVMFLAQTMLMSFYAHALVQPVDLDERLKYRNFCAAIPIQLCAGSQFGGLDNFGFWTKVLWRKHAWTSKVPPGPSAKTGQRLSAHPGQYEVLARCFLSLFANLIYALMILMGLPFILMNAETPMDFVKDCVAIAYITTLDDLPDPIEIRAGEPPSDAESLAAESTCEAEGQPQTRETPESRCEIEDVEPCLPGSAAGGDARP